MGVLVTGTAGSGLLLSHDPLTNVWSSPLSVKLRGVGFGLTVGSEAKDMIVFFQSRDMIIKFATNYHLQLEGRTGTNHWGHKESKEEHHQTTTFCFSSGLYYGVELEGIVIKSNIQRHRDFYGAAITPRQILLGSNKVRCNERSGVKSLHAELTRLAQGELAVATSGGANDEHYEGMETLLSSPSSCCRQPLNAAAPTGVQAI